MVGVCLYVFWAYFSDVAKKVSSVRVAVLSDASFLYVEARKAEKLLLETAEFLCRELAHEELLCVRAITGIAVQVFYLSHSALIPVASYIEAFTKVECVDAYLLCHDDHHVIGRLVIDEQLAVAVGDGASGRILDAFKESVRVGTNFEVLAEQLQREESE
jgi:hypothetical protein